MILKIPIGQPRAHIIHDESITLDNAHSRRLESATASELGLVCLVVCFAFPCHLCCLGVFYFASLAHVRPFESWLPLVACWVSWALRSVSWVVASASTFVFMGTPRGNENNRFRQRRPR
jgi:hypothetical protein